MNAISPAPSLASHIERQQWLRGFYYRQAIMYAVCCAGLIGALVLSWTIDPHDIETGKVVLTPPCPSKVLLRRDCPSCGLTRGFCALGHGRWKQALGYNRGTPVFYAAACIGVMASAVAAGVALRRARRIPRVA